MIHWGWLIVAFYAGVIMGIAAIAPCRVAKQDDERMDEMLKQTREEGYHV